MHRVAASAPRIAATAMVLAGTALAFAIYTPWVGRPFSVLDFSEFLPILRREHNVLTQFFALVDYYLNEHGRLNVVSYAALALKWTLLGDSPMLWHWLRFVQMGVLVGGVYLLARRLGASWMGAAAGASLLVCARTAQEAWVRVTMGEPLGLGFMLGAALVVTDPRWVTRSPGGAAAATGALVAAAILAKEMLVAWVPALLLLGACYQEGGVLGPPQWTPRLRRLVTAVGVATLLSCIAVLLAASARSAEGFTASYRMEGVSLHRLVANWNQMVMPENTSGRSSWWLQRPNILFAVTCLSGLAVAFSRLEGRRHAWLVTGVGVALSAAGALVYLPWPYFSPFYAVPFLVGPSLLLATAVTAVERHVPRVRWAAYAGAASVALLVAMASAYMSRVTIAQQQVNGDLAQLLPRYASADSILVAQPFRPQQTWQGWGPTLVRYALSVGAASQLPRAVDVGCRDIPYLLQGRLGNAVLISYSYYCGSTPGATLRLRRSFTFLDYVTLSVGTDSVGADLFAP